ncbi:MAG TPA: hypothetical protein VE974_13910 [Thermoanaerobaculia bacterium]|nr:hypothetical protein [Thermoanaerobaculia bacterium]
MVRRAWSAVRRRRSDDDRNHDETRLCGAHAGPNARITRQDVWKSLAVTLGGTLLLTALWIALHSRLRDRTYVDAFSAMAFLVPYLFSMFQ